MASPLQDLAGLFLTVDCRAAGCRGERKYAIAELATFYRDATVTQVLQRMRCGGGPSGGCGGRVLAAWLETGPMPNSRVRTRRTPLLGPEARG